MALNAGYEVYENKIIVWSDDHFGEVVKEAFLNNTITANAFIRNRLTVKLITAKVFHTSLSEKKRVAK